MFTRPFSRLSTRKPRSSPRSSPGHLIEALERRQLLSTSTWTGAAGDHLYSDGANWQSGTVPATGDDLVFPVLSTTQTVDFDTTPTVGNIFVSGFYTFTGNNVTVDGDVASGDGTSLNVTNEFVITTNSHFTVGTGSKMYLSGLVDSSSNQLDKYGPGDLVFDGTSSAQWQLLAGTMTLAATTNIQLTEFSGTLAGNGSLLSLTNNGGVVDPGNGTITDATNTYLSGGTVNIALGGSTNNGSIVNSANSVTLANSPTLNLFLGSGFSAAGGTSYTIIRSVGNAESGTFANLPQGAMFTENGEVFTISYTGGSGGHNVVVTTVGAATNVTLTESTSAVLLGNTETLTATVAGIGSLAPSGSVTFTSNGVNIGTVALTASSTNTSVATLVYTPTVAGTFTVTATYTGDVSYFPAPSNSVAFTVDATGPVLQSGATATRLTAKSATLQVRAIDTTLRLEGGLSYLWTVLAMPSGAQTPIITPNNTHGARIATALFTQAGTYKFQVVVSNVNGGKVTSTVQYVVHQYARILKIAPHGAKVYKGKTQQFSTSELDQFGAKIAVQAGVASYTVAAGGSITQAGLFTAGRKAGIFTIDVLRDGLLGTVNLTVI